MAKNSWKPVNRINKLEAGIRFGVMKPNQDSPGNYHYDLGFVESINGDELSVVIGDVPEGELQTISIKAFTDAGWIFYTNPDLTRDFNEARRLFSLGSNVLIPSIGRSTHEHNGSVVKVKCSGYPPKHRIRDYVVIWVDSEENPGELYTFGTWGITGYINVKKA